MGRRRGKVHPVAVVPGAHCDCYPGVVVVGAVGEVLAEELRTGIAVRDDHGTQADRGVLGRAEILHGRGIAFHQQDVAVRTDRRDHLDVERDLAAPALVVGRVNGTAMLVDLPEAAILGGTWTQAELAAVGGQVRCSSGQVKGIDDGHGDPGPGPRSRIWQPIGRQELAGGEASRHRERTDCRPGQRRAVGPDEGQARHVTGRRRRAQRPNRQLFLLRDRGGGAGRRRCAGRRDSRGPRSGEHDQEKRLERSSPECAAASTSGSSSGPAGKH